MYSRVVIVISILVDSYHHLASAISPSFRPTISYQ